MMPSRELRGGGILPGLNSHEAEIVPYTNRVTGKPDPMVVFAPGRFLHLSTCQNYNYVIKADNGERLAYEVIHHRLAA